MKIINKNIDTGGASDRGRASKDYAKYRGIYLPVFYEEIAECGLCIADQCVPDLRTGADMLPRDMYTCGTNRIGMDISQQQIKEAKAFAQQMNQNISYFCVSVEDISFTSHTSDVTTACQCFRYFDYERLLPKLLQYLKPKGGFLLLYMARPPQEDAIAGANEQLVLKYSPNWSGAREYTHPISLSDCVYEMLEPVAHEEYALDIPFTRESRNGRMKTCWGVGVSLFDQTMKAWDREHLQLLKKNVLVAPNVKHYVAVLEMKRRTQCTCATGGNRQRQKELKVSQAEGFLMQNSSYTSIARRSSVL